jgi:xylulokinase
MASVLDAELVTVNTTEGGAHGAALLAGVAAGAWNDVGSACNSCIKITGSTQPDRMDVELYRGSCLLYRDFYPSRKSTFSKL